MLAALSHSALALAQSAPNGEDRDAMPGTWRVPSPLAPRTLVALSLSGGYGWTEPVIDGRDGHHRAAGSLAIALRPLSWLAFGARFDGRYDRHVLTGAHDDGWVGEPRINVRAAGRVTGSFALGGQATVFFPGGAAPSIVPEAISAEGQVFAGYVPRDGRVSLVIRGGFRFDQSARSVRDPQALSASDRLALGVNSAHAALVGLAFAARVSVLEPWFEWTWDAMLTDRLPLAASPMHLTLGARVHPSQRWHVHPGLMLDVSPSGRAPMDAMTPLVEASPRVAVMLTLGLGFPSPIAPAAPRPPVLARRPIRVAPRPVAPPDPPAPPPQPQEPAGIEGVVRDPQGQPVADAIVQIRRGDQVVRELRTDGEGRWQIEDIEPGEYEVFVRIENGGERRATITAQRGSARAQSELVIETPALGAQLRGTVRAYSGDGVAANIRVIELQRALTANADGTFTIAVEPRSYTIEFSAEGYQTQRRRATVRANGVVILNIDLRPAQRRRRR